MVDGGIACGSNWDYNRNVKRSVSLSPEAVRQLKALRAYDRRIVKEGMKKHLEESDATQESRNRFRLRRPSPFVDFELRLGDHRVFYRVDGDQVRVGLIGRKEGDALVVDGRRFIL